MGVSTFNDTSLPIYWANDDEPPFRVKVNPGHGFYATGNWEIIRIDCGEPMEPCRECNGTGKYTGLTQVEDCRACGGKGSV